MLTTEAPPSPQIFFDAFNAYQRTAAVRAAVDLKLFTAIGEGNDTPSAIARRCQTNTRGTRILCDYLVICGMLVKEDGRYTLTRESATFMDERSPAYIGGTLNFLGDAEMMRNFDDLTGCVRNGGTTLENGGSTAPEHPQWVSFARNMGALMVLPAQLLARMLTAPDGGPINVLDVAAGHGLFGINVALANPAAHVTALDWSPVLAVARENAARMGVMERWEARAGSAFEVELGERQYDLVLLTNFLHHFDRATIEKFLKRLRPAVKDGGKVATLEFVPNADRVTPPAAAAFSLVMLCHTSGGEAYTFDDLESMFRHAGFPHNELHELPPTMERVIISK